MEQDSAKLTFLSEAEAGSLRKDTGVRIVDAFAGQICELFFIEHPDVEHDEKGKGLAKKFSSATTLEPVWIHLPWKSTLVRCVPEDTYFRLRTARNRDLITAEEQGAYRAATVGIAGLSVGSTALASLTATGGPKHIKLADPDTVETTNLNRIRATLTDSNENKAVVAARNTWEVDPFAEIELWTEGLSEDTLKRFINDPKLTVFVDEMDDIPLKFACRTACKKARVPVVMATDNEDGAVIDVERFDLEPERPIFHGRVQVADNATPTSRAHFVGIANEIIDIDHFSKRQLQSLKEVGVTLPGIPQLGTGASIAGAAIAYAVRAITTGKEMPSGRYLIDCQHAFSKPVSA